MVSFAKRRVFGDESGGALGPIRRIVPARPIVDDGFQKKRHYPVAVRCPDFDRFLLRENLRLWTDSRKIANGRRDVLQMNARAETARLLCGDWIESELFEVGRKFLQQSARLFDVPI